LGHRRGDHEGTTPTRAHTGGKQAPTDRTAPARGVHPGGDRAEGVLSGGDHAELAEQVARIVHELRSPLATAIQAVGFIAERPEEPPDPTILRVARRQLGVGLRRVEQLLLLLRSDSGRVDLTPEPRRLRELVLGVTREHLGPESGTAVQVDVDPSLWVEVDPDAFVHVLENLVHNATRYAPPDTAVTITSERRGPQTLLRVADRGPGIDPAIFDRVFEPFTRGIGGGAGLGLTIVRHFVEAHGGQVWVEIDPNAEGASLVVTLPAFEPPAT
jgi:signal transduction histidine kinase